MGIEPVGSLQALVFAAMFSGVVSMPEEFIMHDFGVGKKDLVDNFQQGAETSLVRANLLRTTKIETMQAFVMYMVSIQSLQSVYFAQSYDEPVPAVPQVSCSIILLRRAKVPSNLKEAYRTCG